MFGNAREGPQGSVCKWASTASDCLLVRDIRGSGIDPSSGGCCSFGPDLPGRRTEADELSSKKFVEFSKSIEKTTGRRRCLRIATPSHLKEASEIQIHSSEELLTLKKNAIRLILCKKLIIRQRWNQLVSDYKMSKMWEYSESNFQFSDL